jgi:hypothetical protein
MPAEKSPWIVTVYVPWLILPVRYTISVMLDVTFTFEPVTGRVESIIKVVGVVLPIATTAAFSDAYRRALTALYMPASVIPYPLRVVGLFIIEGPPALNAQSIYCPESPLAVDIVPLDVK